MIPRSRRRWAFGSSGWSLPLLLFIAVVVPSACVLWFMNEAVEYQATATRQAVADAYRGQLQLIRTRLATAWQSRTEALNADLRANAAREFQRLVTSGVADSIVVLGGNASRGYPAPLRLDQKPVDGPGAEEATLSQRAIADLVRSGNIAGAIDAIGFFLASKPAARGTDAEGRLIAANVRFLLINLLPPNERRRQREIERLTTLLNDYSIAIPSAQRTFLMQEIRSLSPKASFPTLEAERIAQTFVERDSQAPAGQGRQSTAVPDVWQVASLNGRVIGLFKTQTIVATLEQELKGSSSAGVAFQVIPPGRPSSDEAIPIGSTLPNWEVTFAANPGALDASHASTGRSTYLSIAAMAIVAIAAAAFMIGGAARRQARLASLKTDLVSAVSHELKTPLASMRLLVDALLEDDTLDPAKTRDYLKLMAVENARLTRLIDNFLTFSRLERNRQRFEFAPTNPADIVDEALAAVPEDRRSEHAPHVEIDPDLPPILADRDAMVTVLLNLLDNAYKYSPDDKRISVRVFREPSQSGHVVFAVEDNGIGIPTREQKRIFRRFYRVDQRLARETTGSGLGLSIVDAIVRAHGGKVRVDSRPQQGSTFTVSVPSVTEGALA